MKLRLMALSFFYFGLLLLSLLLLFFVYTIIYFIYTFISFIYLFFFRGGIFSLFLFICFPNFCALLVFMIMIKFFWSESYCETIFIHYTVT